MESSAALPDAGRETAPVRGWEVALWLAAVALFIALRWPFLKPDGLARGWNSDAAIFGLAGKRILETGHVPVFFWGQNYLGPLTSIAAAAIGAVLRSAPHALDVWPLALRLATMAEVLLGIAFYWMGLRMIFGPIAAAAALAWLAVGPCYLFESSVTARDEIVFLCAGILFWLSARSFGARQTARPLDSRSGCLFFGLVAGFSWWMNQGVVFVLAPAAIVILMETDTYAAFRNGLRPMERLLARGQRLGWREMKPGALVAARAWNAGLALLLVLAALRDLGLAVPTFSLFHPLAEPFVLLLASQIAFELAWGNPETHRRSIALAWREVRAHWHRLAAFACGALVGFSPVALGRVLDWYPVTYGRQDFLLGLNGVPSHLARMLSSDVWLWLGADRSVPSKLFIAGSLTALAALTWKQRRDVLAFLTLRQAAATPKRFAGGVVAVCLLFYAVALRLGGPPRYIVAGLPAAYGFVAAGLVSLSSLAVGRRAALAARALSLLLAGVFLWSLTRQVASRREEILAEPDPREVLAAIRSAGYRICYAGYWDAYKLQFVAGETIRFIPYKSRSRNRDESETLALQPGAKCLLLPDGTFRPFVSSDRIIPIRHDGPSRPKPPRSPAADH
jgi:hypothetical protein